MITGERGGAGWVALQVVGGMLSVPFVLYKNTISLLDKLATLAPEDKPQTNAIEPTASGDSSGAGGAD